MKNFRLEKKFSERRNALFLYPTKKLKELQKKR